MHGSETFTLTVAMERNKMPFLIQSECPCCRDFLHHCKRCWDKYHNGVRDKDYKPPEYYGMLMGGDKGLKIQKEMCKMLEKEYSPKIKFDKNRKYEEGDYGH